jgi:hypothetical protein
MKTQLGLLAASVLLGLATVSGGADTSPAKPDTPGLRSETPQDIQQKQQKLDKKNLEEQQRLQAPSLKESTEAPPYRENQPIGGQQQAGPADFPQPAFPFVKGELMKIEGEFYTVRDAEGKEIRVHVDKGTKMDGSFSIGDLIEVQRTLPGHALAIKKASGPMITSPSSSSAGMGPASGSQIVKDEQVTLSGAKQAVRGEVLKIDGNDYVIKDGHGNEVRLAVNKNTRMFCGPQQGSLSGLLPEPSASDKPGLRGQPQDQALTAEQKGSEVGPGTKSAGTSQDCAFKVGDKVEAEISDMGAVTFIKQAGRPQPGQPLP